MVVRFLWQKAPLLLLFLLVAESQPPGVEFLDFPVFLFKASCLPYSKKMTTIELKMETKILRLHRKEDSCAVRTHETTTSLLPMQATTRLLLLL